MASEQEQISALSAPLTLPCGLVVHNRFSKAPMEEMLAHLGGGDPTKKHIALYRTWSEGDWGMVVTGNVMVSPTHLGSPADLIVPSPSSPTYAHSLSRFETWATACHESDSRTRPVVIMQLCHTGRQSMRGSGRQPWVPPLAPSAVPLDTGSGLLGTVFGKVMWQTPKAMTEEDIDLVVAQFVQGAKVAKAAGFDGVQLHASHGYLLAQFMSSNVNVRTDSYGGSARARAKLLLRIIDEVRKDCPASSGFCLGIKLNSSDYVKGGLTEADALDNVKWIAEHGGIDFIEISGGTYESPKMLGEDIYAKGAKPSARTAAREAFFLSFATQAHALLKSLPPSSLASSPPKIMVTGGFRSRAGMAKALASSSTDLIGIGRPACANPALPRTLLDPSIPNDRSPEYLLKGAALLRMLPALALPGIDTIFHTMLLAQIARGEKPDYTMNFFQGFWRVWIRDLLFRGWLTGVAFFLGVLVVLRGRAST